MLEAGHWMLDLIRIFFDLSRIWHPETSIAPHQAMGHLRRQLARLPQ